MSRKTLLAKAILDRLHKAKPYALSEPQLFTEVNGIVRPRVREHEFGEVIAYLGSADCIAAMCDEFDPSSCKWTITEAGEAALLR